MISYEINRLVRKTTKLVEKLILLVDKKLTE